MYTAVPSIGPSIVPSPPMMVANAISAVHCTLTTAPGFTCSWLIASSAPAAPQPAPATTNTSSLARPTRAPELRAATIVQRIVNNLRDKRVLTLASLPVHAQRPDFLASGASPAARRVPAARRGDAVQTVRVR